MQLGGIAGKNMARELSAVGADLGDAAAAREIAHQLVARGADPAVCQQLGRDVPGRLALRHQMPAEPQHMAQPLGQPAANRERKTRQPGGHVATITGGREREEAAETIPKFGPERITDR